MLGADVEVPVHAGWPAIGLSNSEEMTPLYPPEMKDSVPTSTQMAPPLVLTSRTPPSNPSSVMNLCQKMRWLVEDRFCGGAINRSSLMSGAAASVMNE
jgi:hypothetical protein